MSGFSFKAAVVSGLIGLAAVLGAGASAQAAPHGGGGYGSHQGQQMGKHQGHHQNSRPQYNNGNQRYACSPRDAASKASRMGLRNTRVSSNRSTLRVSGIRHGRPATMIFGKARGCPILR